jgi:uncharacterized repeat protein (TIGR03803 family)
MVDSAQQRGRIWRAPLALTFLLASVVVATQSQAQTFTVLHTFHGKDGAGPIGQLVRDKSGNLYGVAAIGGAGKCPGGCGTTFKMNQSGKMVWVHSFNGANGLEPYAGLLRNSAGDFYGTTVFGGIVNNHICPLGCGVAFKLDNTGTKETVLHKFTGTRDGYFPESPLVEDSTGNLYGTTALGGKGYGAVFKIDTTGKKSLLYSFKGGSDGCFSDSGVILDASGNLYGATLEGGDGFCNSGHGVVFKVETSGKETVLYTFRGEDGANPDTVLLFDSHGNLYGTTDNGGASNVCDGGCGTVFKLSPKHGGWSETVLYSFCSLSDCADGLMPLRGPLVRDASGNVYGTTDFGGTFRNCNGQGCGVVFKLNTTGKESVLHNFTGGVDGATPIAGLTIDSAGNLYGAAPQGGDLSCNTGNGQGCGTVFKITP